MGDKGGRKDKDKAAKQKEGKDADKARKAKAKQAKLEKVTSPPTSVR